MSNPNVPVANTAPVEAPASAEPASTIPADSIENTPADKITPDIARKIVAAREAREAKEKEAKLAKVDKVASKQTQVDKPKEEPKPTQAEKRKLKIDDEEVDEEEVLSVYKSRKSHQQAANKELQEGKAARKQAEEFVSMMKNPAKLMEVIQKLGHDPRKLAEEYLVQQLEEEGMDPRDKELRDAKARIKAIDDMEKQKQEAMAKHRDEQLKAKYAQDYTQQFVSALQESGLPPTKPMVAEMARYIQISAKEGFKMTAKEAALLVKEDVQLAHARLIGDSDGETLMKLLGEEVANKVRKYDMAKLKDPNSGLNTPTVQTRRERATGDVNKPANQAEQRKNWKNFNRK